MGGGTSEIAFFNVETTVPFRPGQGDAILEFGSILVCPEKLAELGSYSTPVKPANLNLITPQSMRYNGIKREVWLNASSPQFADIADQVFDILDGRIWAGHNISNFDCPKIREAFAEIGRNPPEPKGIIDSLVLLTQRFGRSDGDMKLATVAAYFGLDKQTHTILDDVKMNIEVLKCCATDLFLKSNFPDELIENSVTTPETSSRRRRNINNSPLQSSADWKTGESTTTNSFLSFVSPEEAQANSFDMSTLRNEIASEIIQSGIPTEEEQNHQSETLASEDTGDQGYFLDLDKISTPCIRATPAYDGRNIQLFLGDRPILLHCPRLKVKFGINGKYKDNAERLKLSFVVYLCPSLYNILQACESAVERIHTDSNRSSTLHPAIFTYKNDDSPLARIHILREFYGDVRYASEIHQRVFSGVTTTQTLISRNPNADELKDAIYPGLVVDAFLSLESYDFTEHTGIRLVGRKLVIHKNHQPW